MSELLRLACIYAEQDRMEFARASRNDPAEHAEAMAMVRQLRAYRLKRWGKTKLEGAIESGVETSIDEIRKKGPTP